MALPDISTEISSLTSEHHEENAKNIRKLDSLDNLFKTYVPQVSDAINCESVKAEENKSTVTSVPPTLTSKATPTPTSPLTSLSLSLPTSTPTQSKTKKTLRSFLHCKTSKLQAKLPRLRIESGEMMTNMRCPPCDDIHDQVDCITPTNSNIQFNAPNLNHGVVYGGNCDCGCDQDTSTTGLYEQSSNSSSLSDMDCENVGGSANSICYCANDDNPNNGDYQSQSYMDYAGESDGYANNAQTCANMSTQSFSQDSCCCRNQHDNSQQDLYEYEYASDDNMQQTQTYSQLTQMAQKIAQQIAQQFYQQQLCQQVGQQIGQQVGQQIGQPIGQQIGQPMAQPMGQSFGPMQASHEGCMSPQTIQQSSGCNCGNERLEQQFSSGMPQMPYCSCNPVGAANCIDVKGFLNNYTMNNTSSPRMQANMCGAFNGNICNGGGVANGGGQNAYSTDMLHSQTVYTTDYKPLNPSMSNPYGTQMMQMTSNDGSCGVQQQTSMNQYACDCNLPGGYNMGNDFGYSYMSSMPTTSCPYSMPMQPTDLNQLPCESMSTQAGSPCYDCSGTGGNSYAPITLCIMCEWNGDCCPPCHCRAVNGLYYPSRYQCALDDACRENIPEYCLPPCKPTQKYAKRNGLSNEDICSNLNGYPNQRRSFSAEPRKCGCFNGNDSQTNGKEDASAELRKCLCFNGNGSLSNGKENTSAEPRKCVCCNRNGSQTNGEENTGAEPRKCVCCNRNGSQTNGGENTRAGSRKCLCFDGSGSLSNGRENTSAEPRKCVCFNGNGSLSNGKENTSGFNRNGSQSNGKGDTEEKFSNIVPPAFLCANNQPKKKKPNRNTKECDCSNESEPSPDLLPINCYISREGVERLCNFYKIDSPPCSCACCRQEESPSFVVLPMTASGGNRNGARMPAQVPNSAAPQRASTKTMGSRLISGTFREAAGTSQRQSKVSMKSRSSSVPSQNDGAKSARGSGKTSAYEEYKQKIEDCAMNCCGPLKTCACEPDNCIDKVPVQLEVPGGDYDCKEEGQKVVCCLNFPGNCSNRNKCCVYPQCCNVTITGAEPIDPPNDSLFDMKRNSKSKEGKDGKDGKEGDPSGGCDCGGQNTDCICTKGGGDDEKGWCCPWYMYGSVPVQPPRGNLYNYFRSTCCSHCWPCGNAAYTSLGQIQQRQEQQRQAFSLCKPPGNAYDQMVQNYEFYNNQQGKADTKSADGGERMDAGATFKNTPKPTSKSFEFPTIYTGNPMGLAHEIYAPFMPWQQSCSCPGGGYVMIGNKYNSNPFSNSNWLP